MNKGSDSLHRLFKRLRDIGFTFDSSVPMYNPMEKFLPYVSPKEIVHSRIIAELLDPRKSDKHGLKSEFLHQFLKKCDIQWDIEDVEVLREYHIKDDGPEYGRSIDILITGVHNGGKVAVIVENKLNEASYQKNQIEDYYNAILRMTRKSDNIRIVCLHRDYVSNSFPLVNKILYPDDIAEAIDKAIENTGTKESSYIQSYSRCLRNLNIKNMAINNASILNLDEITNDDIEYIRAIINAYNSLPQAYAKELVRLVREGGIKGADQAEIEYKYNFYAAIWNQSVYDSSRMWLSIGFFEHEVQFYFAAGEQDWDAASQDAEKMGLTYTETAGGRYWFVPKEGDSMSRMEFDGKPDFSRIMKRAETLLERFEILK
jgi:hypothetical protein